MTTSKTALVLGATGGIGGAVARTLLGRGWTVRALNRNPDRVKSRDGLDWRRGDAMSPAEVTAAAEGAALIVHAVNPPGYRDWDKLVLPMLDSSIAAARASGARVLLPGTVYNYGPDAWPRLTEASPQNPTTRKGAIRVQMENRVRDLADGGGRVLILRAGDFFGPRPGGNWFSECLVTPGRTPKRVVYPGPAGIGHQWAYLPDAAETMVRLVEAEPAEAFASYHFGGHWDPDGTAMIEAIRRAVGDPGLPVRRLPWRLLRLASPFVTFIREMDEMRPLWLRPIRMENAKLAAAIGAEPHTPLDQAVRETLAALGCLAAPARGVALMA